MERGARSWDMGPRSQQVHSHLLPVPEYRAGSFVLQCIVTGVPHAGATACTGNLLQSDRTLAPSTRPDFATPCEPASAVTNTALALKA